ncbi:CsiV family protein [Pseudomonadota bacterium]
MKKIKSSILTILLLLPAFTTQAETRQYNVEIVIFEDKSSRYLNSEQWPFIIHPSEVALSTELVNETSNISPSKLLDPALEPFPDNELETLLSNNASKEINYEDAQYPENNNVIQITHDTTTALIKHVARLKRSSRYNVLVHQSWQQTGLNSTDAINIQINSNNTESVEDNDTNILIIENKTAKPDNQKQESNVEGGIKLILGRYLHIHTDLLYKRLKSTYRPNSPALHSNIFDEFRIKSQRRMRSKELHYIDHPLLGILVLVSPIEKPEPTSTEENEESGDA